jgi:hypothetical protein
MWKIAFCFVLVALAAVALSHGAAAAQGKFEVCESTYALCTTAKCTPISGHEDTVFCQCEVKTGLSLGQTPCHSKVESPEGTQILSRYYPIKSYAACTNDRPWAWCFDKPCIVDKNDPSKATCACGVVKNKGPYVMVTDTYNAKTCTTDLYSSAKVRDFKKATNFLKTSKLKPFELKVLNEK